MIPGREKITSLEKLIELNKSAGEPYSIEFIESLAKFQILDIKTCIENVITMMTGKDISDGFNQKGYNRLIKIVIENEDEVDSVQYNIMYYNRRMIKDILLIIINYQLSRKN